MEEMDELCQLEKLLAAESSEDECSSFNKPTDLNESSSKSSFLQEVIEKEEQLILSHGKENLKSNKINCNGQNSKNPSRTGSTKKTNGENNSLIHSGDTDSSDDEEKRNFLERKYTDYGMDVKRILQHKEENKDSLFLSNYSSPQQSASFKINKSEPKKISNSQQISINSKEKEPLNSSKDIYSDPIFGMRIVKPLISSVVLKERMQGREAINMNRVQRHVAHSDLSKDWVIAGAIVRKSASQESQKGSQYCIWTLSDLKDDLKTVSLFLFRNAYKQLWKTNVGMIVGILNPNVLDKRDDSKDQACLSVDNPEKVMIFGNSKDFGFCKSRKNNGDPCTAFVNTTDCGYCIYHVKQEYQKCSRRSDLQSSTCGRGLVDLRNKVLGKNTVIYGGKSFSAIPATKNIKQTKKDNNRLQTLSNFFKPSEQSPINKSPVTAPVKKMASRVDASTMQRLKDLERLEFLRAGSSQEQSSPKIEKRNDAMIPNNGTQVNQTNNVKLNGNKQSPPEISAPNLGIPLLGFGLKKNSTVDLSIPVTKKHADRAKANAVKWIQQNGPLNKTNPHNIRGTSVGKKRNISKLNVSSDSESNNDVEQTPKKLKTGVNSEAFQKMLATTSAHADLVVQHDDSEADKYFNKLEKKEMMEEKMLNTYKVACKAVRCLKCSYTSFSAADRCKQERHPLKVFDTVKRFFKCSHCKNRQVSLDIIPTQACRNCNNMSWQRTGMIAEKKTSTTASKLSITGEEEFLGHVQHGADINLLVPES